MRYVAYLIMLGMIIISIWYVIKDESSSEEENGDRVNNYKSILEYVVSEVRLHSKVGDESEIKVGSSKLGGRPDLPTDIEWPVFSGKYISFLAQINLGELKDVYAGSNLPEEGILYFFYDNSQDSWGISQDERDSWRVIYSKSDDNLRRTDFPRDLDKEDRFQAGRIALELRKSYPQWENDVVQESNASSRAVDKYMDFVDRSYGDSGLITKVLGYPNQIQGNMDIECEMIKRGMTYKDLQKLSPGKRSRFNKESKRWKLLFQLDSKEDLGMMWGDAGRLYFWIDDDDLAKENFENSWMIFQCY